MMARIRLRLIINDICAKMYSASDNVPELYTRALAEFKQRLIQWHLLLSDRLETQMIVLPSELKLHMEFQSLLLLVENQQALYRRTVALAPTVAPSVQPGLTADGQLALSRLETILRLYFLRHGFDFFDAYLTYFLWLLADSSLNYSVYGSMQDDVGLSALQSNLVLSFKGLGDQSRITLVSCVTILILRDRISAEDMKVVKERLRWDPAQYQGPSPEALMRSQWGDMLRAWGGDLRQTVLARFMVQP
ncbi:hypothetical protein CDD81_3176 [Ophiocordyceps australis]|uniref:Uncharacterized protein n=1 Tax=Ophiocordyceps australis TaxID=1399860 RepID=A0A2C5XVH6_9HYPO|nr:hypothetical protein CDD81_3176 [Ophiocordyceps australis]